MLYGFNAGEIFSLAITIEENGRLFYEQAGKKIDDPEVKELFRALALAEIQHREYFVSLLGKLPESARKSNLPDPDNQENLYLSMMAGLHVFKQDDSVTQMVADVKGAEDALKTALAFEKDSIVFFLEMKNQTDEKQGKSMIDQLVNEELAHHKRISLELLKFKKP